MPGALVRERRRRAHQQLAADEQVCHGPASEAPLDRAPVAQFASDALPDQDAAEVALDVGDAANEEAPFVADLPLAPVSCRPAGVPRPLVLRYQPFVPSRKDLLPRLYPVGVEATRGKNERPVTDLAQKPLPALAERHATEIAAAPPKDSRRSRIQAASRVHRSPRVGGGSGTRGSRRSARSRRRESASPPVACGWPRRPRDVRVPDRLPAVAGRVRPAVEGREAVPAIERQVGARQARAAAAEGPDAPQEPQRLALSQEDGLASEFPRESPGGPRARELPRGRRTPLDAATSCPGSAISHDRPASSPTALEHFR